MTKLSVIIPVYNVERYLSKCLDSVINQTFQDLEIICVNDASTDNSLLILQKYKQRDPRIMVINNEKNIGLGLTRNRGMEYATGEYIHFLDSDDWLEQDSYKKLCNISEMFNKPDVIHFEYQYVSNLDGTKSKRSEAYYKDDLFNKVLNIEQEKDIIKLWDRHAWNKLYRTKFLQENNLFFNDYPCYEDIEFAFNVLIKSESICFIRDILLNYRYNNSSSLISKYYYLHNDYVYKSYLTALELSSSLNEDLRECLMLSELGNMNTIFYGAYKIGDMSYCELRNRFKKIDYSIYHSRNLKKGIFSYTFDIINYPEFVFKLKKGLTYFIKQYFPKFYNFFINKKNEMLGIK